MEPEAVRILKWVYLIVFLVGSAFVIALSIFNESTLQLVQFSQVTSVIGNGYGVLQVFKFLATFYLFLMFIDTVSLFNYKSLALREVSAISSLVGFLLMGMGSLFMIYVLALSTSISTEVAIVALLYLVIAVGLFLLDLLTFFVEEEGLLSLSLKRRKK